jgi:predicted nucleic acid-binding protein
MNVVDASVWVSSLVVNDVNHEASRRWLDRQLAEGHPLYGPWIVLPEITGAIVRRTGSKAIAESTQREIEGLVGSILTLDALDEALARESARLTIELGLRGADATYVAVAARRSSTLITWDREQRERSASVVSVASPADDLDGN